MYDRIWDSPLTERVADALLERSRATGAVVDLGCGTGLVSRRFLSAGRPVIGVDGSQAMLKRATRRGRITSAHLAPVERTGLPSDSAPTVVLSNVLHLHPEPTAVLDEARRIAGPEGRIVISWPNELATHEFLISADLRSGRSLLSTVVAHVLRTGVARFAVALQARTTPSEALELLVGQRAHSFSVSSSTVAGCQRVVVIGPGEE